MKKLWALALITILALMSSDPSSSVMLAQTNRYLPNSDLTSQEFGVQESHVL